MRREVDQLAVEPEDGAHTGLAQPAALCDDGLEHRLDVGRRLEMTRRISLGGGLLLERLGEVAVARLQLREEAHVLDGDHGLVGEGLEERDLAVRERPARPRMTAMTPIATAVAQHRHGQDRAVAEAPRASLASGNSSPRPAMSATWTAAASSIARPATVPRLSEHRELRRWSPIGTGAVMGSDDAGRLAVETEDGAVERIAQPGGALGDGVEHGLDVGRRSRDHPQDLAGRGLLLERFGQVALRVSSSLNRRTFSMAITAWSAKVCSSSICCP